MNDYYTKKEQCKIVSTVVGGAVGGVLTGGNPVGMMIGAKVGEHVCNVLNPPPKNNQNSN